MKRCSRWLLFIFALLIPAAASANAGTPLMWTTVGGARAMLMEDKIGTLSPGKKADIVMLRADDLNMMPVYDPVASIVEIAGPGNVDTVIIDGVTRKKDGRLTFPADVLRKRRDELRASGERIMREGGYVVGQRL